MKRTFIARADDFGSAQAANAAILEALTQGCLIRNVSCMAPGPHIARDAEALRAFAARVDLGLHLTVNSEWDTVAWTPCGPPAAAAPLLDRRGRFYQTGEALAAAAPPVEAVLRERRPAGPADRSGAAHHLSGRPYVPLPLPAGAGRGPAPVVPGKGTALRRRPSTGSTRRPGLRPHLRRLSQAHRPLAPGAGRAGHTLHHPSAKLSHETCAFSNGSFPPGVVAWERELEYRSALDAAWHARLASLTPVRFRDLAQEE